MELCDILNEFEHSVEACSVALVQSLKKQCTTYADMDLELKRVEQDIRWRGKLKCLPLIEAASVKIEEEKSHLLVTGGSSL